MDLAPYSVLISIYKNENPEYLNQSLQSVLNQTKPPNEIVIVKDGPLTEDLERVLVSFSRENQNLFKIISYENNRGLWYALMTAIQAFAVSGREDRPVDFSFDHAECFFPAVKWFNVEGLSADDLTFLTEFVRTNAPFIFELAERQKAGPAVA